MADFSAAQSNSSSHLKCWIGYGSNLGGIANIGNFTLLVFIMVEENTNICHQSGDRLNQNGLKATSQSDDNESLYRHGLKMWLRNYYVANACV